MHLKELIAVWKIRGGHWSMAANELSQIVQGIEVQEETRGVLKQRIEALHERVQMLTVGVETYKALYIEKKEERDKYERKFRDLLAVMEDAREMVR